MMVLMEVNDSSFAVVSHCVLYIIIIIFLNPQHLVHFQDTRCASNLCHSYLFVLEASLPEVVYLLK